MREEEKPGRAEAELMGIARDWLGTAFTQMTAAGWHEADTTLSLLVSATLMLPEEKRGEILKDLAAAVDELQEIAHEALLAQAEMIINEETVQ